MAKTIKMTIPMLERLIKEEHAKFGPMKETEKEAEERSKELGVEDTDELGSLEEPKDWMKVLKIKEAKLIRALKSVRKQIQEANTKRGKR